MQALINQNKIEETPPALENLTTTTFSLRREGIFDFFTNAITVKTQGALSLANKLEIQNVKSFKKLVPNWDGYDAIPVDEKSIEKSIDFIKQVNNLGIDVYLTSPGPNGEVLVQLKNGEREIEFIFYPDKAKYVLFDNANFINQGDFIKNNLGKMIDWLYEERR